MSSSAHVTEDREPDHVVADAARRLLAAHPDARVVALDVSGLFTPMPETVSLTAGQHVIEDHTTAMEFVLHDEIIAVADAWRHAHEHGRAAVDVHPNAVPDATMTMHFFDTRAEHGVYLGVLTGEGARHISDARGERNVLRPRLITARENRYGIFTQVDDAMQTILGHTDLIDSPAIELVHPEDMARVVAVWVEMLSRPGASQRMRNRQRHVDGHWVWFEITLHNLLDDPDEGAVLVEMIDISDEMAAHDHVVAQETLLRRLTDSLPVGVVQVDAQGMIVHRNPQADALFGRPDARTIGDLLVNVAEVDAEVLADATQAALADVDSDVEISLQRDADVRRCQVILRAVADAAGGPSGFLLCVSDVTEPARLRDQLHVRATSDLLTGCHNRDWALQALERALADGSRGTAVTFIDLDGFKSVNDRRGHAAGDALLRDIGHCLRASVRLNDVVGRFGGDEFILVHPDVTSAELALEVAERLAASLAVAFRPEPPHAAVASIGVAWVAGPGCPIDADAVITRADSAMYRSKSRGDGRPVLFDDATASAISEPAPA